jgi:DNA invertase Pin-like site-specific DNA recombinase
MGVLIGYARVSTEEQSLGAQLDALRAAGASVILEEHASGAARARPALRAALERVGPGDTLLVARIDRLARSLSHLLEVVEALRSRGAHFRSLADPIDTSSPSGVLVLQMLGAVAEFERSLIRERTRAGLRAAKGRGRVGGNPGLRSGAAVAALAAARRRARLARLEADAAAWLPLVRALRPATPWPLVADAVNAQLGPALRRPFTAGRLVRAIRLLAEGGRAEAGLLAAAPRRPPPRATPPGPVEVVAALARARPGITLAGLGAELLRLRCLPPGGGGAWAISSVKALRDRAAVMGLLDHAVV